MKSPQIEQWLEEMGAVPWGAPEDLPGVPLPDDVPVPAVEPDRISIVTPSDIRGPALAGAAGTIHCSRSLPDLDVAFLVMDRHGGGLTGIEGRVWLRNADACDVVWVVGDHVLGSDTLASGEVFRFEGAPLSGWALEFHPHGSARSYLIEAPRP